jgi:hypothetical protein
LLVADVLTATAEFAAAFLMVVNISPPESGGVMRRRPDQQILAMIESTALVVAYGWTWLIASHRGG